MTVTVTVNFHLLKTYFLKILYLPFNHCVIFQKEIGLDTAPYK